MKNDLRSQKINRKKSIKISAVFCTIKGKTTKWYYDFMVFHILQINLSIIKHILIYYTQDTIGSKSVFPISKGHIFTQMQKTKEKKTGTVSIELLLIICNKLRS